MIENNSQELPEYPFEPKDINVVASADGNVRQIGGAVPTTLRAEEVTSLEGLGTLQRTYTPLTGNELMEAILVHIRQCLERSNKFPAHIVTDRGRWKFMIVADYDAYVEIKVKVSGEAGVECLVPELKGKDEPEFDTSNKTKIKDHIEVKGGMDTSEMPPDEVREATGQEVPVINSRRSVIKVHSSMIKGKKR